MKRFRAPRCRSIKPRRIGNKAGTRCTSSRMTIWCCKGYRKSPGSLSCSSQPGFPSPNTPKVLPKARPSAVPKRFCPLCRGPTIATAGKLADKRTMLFRPIGISMELSWCAKYSCKSKNIFLICRNVFWYGFCSSKNLCGTQLLKLYTNFILLKY